jgi:F-type H+-transporting ATPase subunit delta
VASAASSLTLIAKRYAEALFALATGPQLETAASDLTALRGLLATSEDLRALVGNPLFDRAEQQKAIAAIVAKAGFGDLTRRFIGVIATNHRLFALDAIAAEFLAELARRRGEMTVEVTSARKLTPRQVATVETGLNTALAAKTSLDLKVDPSLLGGLKIRVGSQLIDASVKSRLDRLGHILKTAA